MMPARKYRGYKVSVRPTVEPITVAEAKIHLKVDGSDEDAYIRALIEAARTWVERHIDAALMPQTIEESWDCLPTDSAEKIMLRVWPVREIISVVYIDSVGVPATWLPINYVVNPRTVPVELAAAAGKTWPTVRDQAGAVVITYLAGHASAAQVPAPIKQAILLIVGELYEKREDSIKQLPTASERLLMTYTNWTF
jgi:uncharacterized phiE125 gp8 family phage protein